ncbi:MAG TPA: hypothetical protein VIH22_06675 [Cyclobacteriaceae bacterium]
MTTKITGPSVKRWLFSTALSTILLASCYSYKPYLDARNTSPETISQKVSQGKRYALTVVGGKKVEMRVDSVLTDRLIGDIHFRLNKAHMHQKDYTIYFNQIESVKERKLNAALTMGLIGCTVGIAILVISNMTFNFGPGF